MHYIPLPLDHSLTAHERECFALLDRMAFETGSLIAKQNTPPAELRKRAAEYQARGLYWLAGENEKLADALERDVRLAALTPLYFWARANFTDGWGATWARQYGELLRAHLEAQAQQLIAAE